MNFDKESISEDFFWRRGGGGGGGGSRREVEVEVGFQTKKLKYNSYLLIFQVSGSSGSLVLTQTKGVTDRKGT